MKTIRPIALVIATIALLATALIVQAQGTVIFTNHNMVEGEQLHLTCDSSLMMIEQGHVGMTSATVRCHRGGVVLPTPEPPGSPSSQSYSPIILK